ncbi:hyaluronoglucosaminidase [Arthrobacter woluwensis]|uniref:Hyaluronoglucosaminidase n=2 Tax=Arthrobacter woluwensis TaxID=156980 RepID=A0A1H4JL61_9MICC|nr:hyaluronoglucosaminidase [Arthrobacter woluwensis]
MVSMGRSIRNSQESAAPHRVSRRGGTMALAVTLALGGLSAGAAPASAGTPATSPAATESPGSPPAILPAPQSMQTRGEAVPLTGKVTIVTGSHADQPTVDAVRAIVQQAGGKPEISATPRSAGKEIYLGTVQDNPAISHVVAGMGAKDAAGLRADGYVLTSGRYEGRPVIALNGYDIRGTFYAAQSLRQLVQRKSVPGVVVRDWPLMSIRGAIEGFYGIPWSQQARLDQFAFYAEHKLNTYIYTPKDDALLRAQWRTLYSGADLDRMDQLVKGANAKHVDFTFALSPGNDICYSSDADFQATVAKFEQLRKLGVQSFYVALDDIPLSFHCAADKAKYPDQGNWHWLADAQADYLNRLEKEYIKPHGLPPLQTVPTNYNGSGPDPYKGEFGARLDPDIRVQWTGEGVFSDTITTASVQRASTSYATKHLYIWDNFPVNDGQRGRLFLNPLTGRDPELYKYIDGITSNPMIEPYASLPALAGYGDYTWNGPAYDPAKSMASALRELAGPDAGTRAALDTFADLNQNWPYRSGTENAPALSKDMQDFWAARDRKDPGAATALLARLTAIERLPQTLPRMAQPGFARDSKPWIDAAALWGTALRHQLAMLKALDAGDGTTATAEYFAASSAVEAAKEPTVADLGDGGAVVQNVITPSVGDGAFEAFSSKAAGIYRDWLGATPLASAVYPGTATSTLGTYSTYGAGSMTDGDPQTFYWSNEAPVAGSAVQLDLGAVKPVGSIVVRQSDSDTQTGDMIYNAALEYSADGVTWTTAGTFTARPLVQYSFDAPVQARYVRWRATAPNSGGQWVKIREIQAEAPSSATSNLASVPGQGAPAAFDADPGTAYQAASTPVSGSFLQRTLDAPVSARQVEVVGATSGTVQVLRNGSWVDLGAVQAGTPYAAFAVDPSWAVSGVRILFTSGPKAPRVNELVLR